MTRDWELLFVKFPRGDESDASKDYETYEDLSP
jgi:hypothetical protein